MHKTEYLIEQVMASASEDDTIIIIQKGSSEEEYEEEEEEPEEKWNEDILDMMFGGNEIGFGGSASSSKSESHIPFTTTALPFAF